MRPNGRMTASRPTLQDQICFSLVNVTMPSKLAALHSPVSFPDRYGVYSELQYRPYFFIKSKIFGGVTTTLRNHSAAILSHNFNRS